MKKNVLTKYLAVFLLICIVLDGIMLCFFAEKPWWNNWMITGPTWLLVYKGIKMLLTIATLVLYIVFVKESSKAFVIITASAYLVSLVAETFVYNHYIKNLNKQSKA